MDSHDLARTLSLLDQYRAGGEYVLHSARMVGDEDDHAIWRQSRRVWSSEAVALVQKLSADAARDLALACRAAEGPGNWKKQYVAELESVEAGLERLLEFDQRIVAAPPGLRVEATVGVGP